MCVQAANNGRLSQKSDIYSLGVVLWELLTKDAPYSSLERNGELPRDALLKAVKGNTVPKVPPGAPAGVAALITSCLRPVEADRPTAENVLEQLRLLSGALNERELTFLRAPHWGCGLQDNSFTACHALFR